jgi:hypothetical protein
MDDFACRFASIGHKYKQQLMSMSRNTGSAMLPPVIEVPSVATMQGQRKQMLECQDLLPRSYSAGLWHDELRTQCMLAIEQETYSCANIQAILLDFFASRLNSLTNASILLHLRRPLACGIEARLDDAVRSIAHEYEQVAAWRQEVASASKAWQGQEQAAGAGLEQACTAHLMWLVHRHHAWHQMSR